VPEITVPDGTDLTRIAILPFDFRAGSDMDLRALDKDGNLLSNLTGGNDEHVDLTSPAPARCTSSSTPSRTASPARRTPSTPG
jgi:hypothetical protein